MNNVSFWQQRSWQKKVMQCTDYPGKQSFDVIYEFLKNQPDEELPEVFCELDRNEREIIM